MSNIPYKIYTFIVLLLLCLINFNVCKAQILTQPSLGTMTSINNGTDRIINILQEDYEEDNKNISSDVQKNKTSLSDSATEEEKPQLNQTMVTETEDIEIFYPHSEANVNQNQIYNGKRSSEAVVNKNMVKETEVTQEKNDYASKNKNRQPNSKENKNDFNPGIKVIATVGGGVTKLNTGNGGEIKNHITGFDIAVVRELKNTHSKLKIGGIIDYNHNKYDNGANGILGNGNSNAFMVGIFARQTGKNNFYYEGSARFGRAKADLNSNNLISDIPTVSAINYEESAPVYAGHAKLGKIIKLNDKNNVDVYGIYSFAHQDRVNINLSSNENYDLGSIYSSRLKTGCRLTTKVKNGKVYYGLAYQYEAKAKIKSRQNGIETGISSGKGNTGLIELGYKLSANKDKTANLDLNVSGFSGRQKGFSIQAQFVKSI